MPPTPRADDSGVPLPASTVTLLSESIHDLCRDQLPPLASARPLGEHGLKDPARREAVFQLCDPDLPQSFPPLRTMHAPAEKETPSIAVLPFVNMSRDEENEYFADGLAEELLNVLSKIRAGLRSSRRWGSRDSLPRSARDRRAPELRPVRCCARTTLPR